MSEVFLKDNKEFVKIDAQEEPIELPRLTLKKILALTSAVDTLVKVAKEKSPELFTLFTKNEQNDNMSLGIELVKLAPSILPVILEEMSTVIAIYIGKPKDWVQDNMDMGDLVAVATPFFVNISKQANHVLGPLSNLFPKQSQNLEISQ